MTCAAEGVGAMSLRGGGAESSIWCAGGGTEGEPEFSGAVEPGAFGAGVDGMRDGLAAGSSVELTPAAGAACGDDALDFLSGEDAADMPAAELV